MYHVKNIMQKSENLPDALLPLFYLILYYLIA
ncbi:Uncharacterised protein [Legionella israelensis]|nr:Uncharacterised protein [Legionella israelensis]